MKSIVNPIDLARQAADDFKTCYGADLVSVILHGSATGKEFDPKRSDINLLVVLSAMTLPMIEKSRQVQEKWMAKRFARPLFMDKEYIANSLDSFPMEFYTMRERYTLVHGEDVLKDLNISDRHLRLQAERELKGKWLHLLQEWPAVQKRPKMLTRLLRLSMSDFGVIFRVLLHLKSLPVPRDRKELFIATDAAFGLEGKPLERTLDAFRSGDHRAMYKVFTDYSRAIRLLTKSIDQLIIKEEV
jgi:hypothetical protein